MTRLQAAWLGSWKAPWGLGRGRRWGDPAWSLAALAQAWLAGGHNGAWPRTAWTARPPEGPRLETFPDTFSPLPSRAWISLLRHGSPKLPPDRRARGESNLASHCWQRLLEGDGRPWMAYGTVLLDRPTRTRWIPVLGAVDEAGRLRLPPFLEGLVPPWLRQLPQGWWAFLLARTDTSGFLLPEGPPPADFPWALLEPEARGCLEPLLLREPPGFLTPAQQDRWGIRLAEDAWMLDPRLRAWGRGLGLAPQALVPLVPPSLAQGDLPEGGLPDPPQLPPPDGPGGYPSPGTEAHPCADPFHWLAASRRARDPEAALQALLWAHGHFARLGCQAWTQQVAAEAVRIALVWGDMAGAESWRVLRGPGSVPCHEEAEFLAARGDWERAMAHLHAQPGSLSTPEGRILYARGALLLDRPEWMREAQSRLEPGGLRDLLEAALGGPRRSASDPDPGVRLLAAFQDLRRGAETFEAFWRAWAACPQHALRMETGLRVLEAHPAQRASGRLLDLRELADRSGSPLLRDRLAALWPALAPGSEPPPLRLVEDWLRRRKRPTWLVWGHAHRPSVLGTGIRPPASLLVALHEKGSLAPVRAQGNTWWGHALHWEGSPVGSVLTLLEPDAALRAEPDAQLLAPWLARLAPPPSPPEPPPSGNLLTDGSEPMASVLVELARVAPSALPVLILGPTGCGKELTARELHARSGRKGSFWPINCSEYAETLLESELFGHAKGAYTGADRDRKGALESAEGGTLFLDEVADLSPRLQSLFLRVLQEKEVRRVGSDQIHRVDVRFLAATHRPLEQLAASGLFRKDLLFRLKGTVLALPSLRERRHEFPYLVPRLVSAVAREAGLTAPALAPGLPQALARLPWPGNVRELRHALARALLRCGDGILKAGHFPELSQAPELPRTWEDGTREFQRRLLLTTLRRLGFQATRTAQDLGLTRPALYTVAKRLGIDLVAERARWEAEEEN